MDDEFVQKKLVSLKQTDTVTILWPEVYIKVNYLHVTVLQKSKRDEKYCHICDITSKNVNEFITACDTVFENYDNSDSNPFQRVWREVDETEYEDLKVVYEKNGVLGKYSIAGALVVTQDQLRVLLESVIDALLSSIVDDRVQLLYALIGHCGQMDTDASYSNYLEQFIRWNMSESEIFTIFMRALTYEEKLFLVSHMSLVEATLSVQKFFREKLIRSKKKTQIS